MKSTDKKKIKMAKEFTEAEKEQLNALWKNVPFNEANRAMGILWNYLNDMKKAVVYGNTLVGGYPENAKGSNFDKRREAFNGLLKSFHDWNECMDLKEITL